MNKRMGREVYTINETCDSLINCSKLFIDVVSLVAGCHDQSRARGDLGEIEIKLIINLIVAKIIL